MARRPRILRSRDPLTYTTLQRGNPPRAGLGQSRAGDKDVSQLAILARMRVAAAGAVSRVPWNSGSKIPRS